MLENPSAEQVCPANTVNGNAFLSILLGLALSIQVCPKEGISPTILFWGWDVSTINPTNFREGSRFLGWVTSEASRVASDKNPPLKVPSKSTNYIKITRGKIVISMTIGSM